MLMRRHRRRRHRRHRRLCLHYRLLRTVMVVTRNALGLHSSALVTHRFPSLVLWQDKRK